MNVNIRSYGEGLPLVFFHGWGFDSRIWLPLVPQLSRDYQIILIDLPGFGHTPIMEWELFKKFLLEQLPKHFALIGWSMGGLYAIRLAVEEPDRVYKLINIASSPRFLYTDLWPGVSPEVLKNSINNYLQSPKVH